MTSTACRPQNETSYVPALTLDLLRSVSHGYDGEAARLDLERPLLSQLDLGLLAAVIIQRGATLDD